MNIHELSPFKSRAHSYASSPVIRDSEGKIPIIKEPYTYQNSKKNLVKDPEYEDDVIVSVTSSSVSASKSAIKPRKEGNSSSKHVSFIVFVID